MSRRSLLLAPALAAAAALLYLPAVVGGEFLNYDDPYLVVQNEVVREARIAHILDPSAPREALGSEYLPARDLSYALDAALFAGDEPTGAPMDPDAATGFRASNMLWYALACALCALFLQRLLEAERSAERSAVALLGALLFALHPAHAESAAWVAGRKDLVSAVFVFAALLAHLRARDGDRPIYYVASAVFAGLACFGKSTATALPLFVLAVEVWNPRPGATPSWKRRLARTLPTLVMCGAVAVLAVWVGRQTGISEGLSVRRLIGRLFFEGVLPRDAVFLRHYLVTGFAPFQLRISHHDLLASLHPSQDSNHAAAAFFLCLLPLAVVTGLWRRRRARFVALWFVGGLLPVLSLIPLTQVIADRFLFLPVLGPCLVLALGLVRLDRSRPALARGGAVLLLVLWGGLTVQRGLEFKTSVSLWTAQVEDEPGDGFAWRHLGEAHLENALAKNDPLGAAAAARSLERSLAAFADSPLGNPGHELEAAYLLARAHERLGDRPASVRAMLDAHERLARLPDPRLRRAFGAKIWRALKDLANDLAGSDDPANLSLAIRAQHVAGNRQGKNQLLRILRGIDPAAADALEKELGRE